MIINKSDRTLVLEWMGRKKDLPANWSVELDKESEDYLCLKYRGEIVGNSNSNLIVEMVKNLEEPKPAPKRVAKNKINEKIS